MTYPIVNVVHVFGVATLFGAVLVLDLRLLGAWRRAPLAPITTIAAPVANNPVLLVKFSAIGLGLVNAVALRRTAAWKARATPALSLRAPRRNPHRRLRIHSHSMGTPE